MTVRQWTVAPTAARVPPGSVIYAVGDVHGCDGLLQDMHHAILADAGRRSVARKVVVYLGDYVSRGPRSCQAVELLTAAPLPCFEVIRLRGNHEDVVIKYLNGDLVAGRQWLTYGGTDALASYGLDPGPEPVIEPERLQYLLDRFRAVLPPAHENWIRGAAIYHQEGDYRFVHGGVRPGVPLARQSDTDMVWIRQLFLGSTEDFGTIVVHGHTVAPEPEVWPNRIGIDTGAYKTGRLTCLALEGNERMFLQTGG